MYGNWAMVNKKPLIALICAVFILGLFVGFTVLRNDFSSQRKMVPVEADLVYAYYKVYNASEGSGIETSNLASYVVILNITNLSDEPLTLSEVRIMSSLADYHRGFPNNNNDYYWSAHSSRLVAFSQTGPLSDPDALKFNRMNFIATVGLMATAGKDSGSAIIQKTGLPLTGISEDEYVYGTSFGNGYKFGFNDEGISIGFTRVTFSPGD